jgi:hypothetical protein
MAGRRMAWATCAVALSCGVAACPTTAGDLKVSGVTGVVPVPTPSLPPPPLPVVVTPPPLTTPPSLPPPPVSVPVPAPTPVSVPQPTTTVGDVSSEASGAPAGNQAGSAAASAPVQPESSAAPSAAAPSRAAPRGSAARNVPPAVRRRRAARQTDMLRRLVFRHVSCLPTLPAIERAVLTIRAGVGERRGHSVRYVAQRLDTSRRRVRKFERRGLRHLRERGACVGRESRPTVPTGAGAVAAGTTSVSNQAGSTGPGEGGTGGHGVKSARTPDVKRASLPPVASEPPPPKPPDQGFLLVLGILVVVAVASLVRSRLKGRGSN